MLDKAFIAYVLQLALNYTGNPPLPADFPLPEVEFVTKEALVLKSCEYRMSDELPECIKYYDEHNIVGLYDRFHPRIYIVKNLEEKMKRRDVTATGVLLHEWVHVLQTHYRHHDNPLITKAELEEDEVEAHAIERRFILSNSEK